MNVIPRLYDITCEICKNAFISGQQKSKWCSDPCREVALVNGGKAKAQSKAEIVKRKDAAVVKKKGRKFDSEFNNIWLCKAL